jgi:phosphonate transport system substrate-binding protein
MKRRHFLWYSFFLTSSCTAISSNSKDSSSYLDTESSSRKLRFTVTDLQDFEELQREYGKLRIVLEDVLEKEIEFVLFESYVAAAVALQSDRVDFVLTGPSEYVVMRARTNAIPIIGITRPDYHTVICVSAHSKIKSVAQLKGKTIAMWNVGSTSGHLGTAKLLIEAGLDPKSDLKILMLGNVGLSALQKGEVDAWGGSSARYGQFLQEQDLPESNLPVITKGLLLPNDVFVLSSRFTLRFAQEVRSRMIKNQDKLLQSLSSLEEGKYKDSKLILANDSDYQMIREAYKAVGQGSFLQ